MTNLHSRELLEQGLQSEHLTKSLHTGLLLDDLSGHGLLKKFKRPLLIPGYVSYLLNSRGHLNLKSTAYLFWGREIRLPLKDYDALALSIYGFPGGAEFELRLIKFFIKNLKPEDIFYDLGANYGFYTYLSTELCNEVHSFEPIPSLYRTIQTNTYLYKNVFVNKTAVSDTNGETDLHLAESSGLSTINPIALTAHGHVNGVSKKITVPTVTLDEYVRTHHKPTFLKIDVEGAEEKVILGGKEFFKNASPVIAMEVWGKESGNEVSKKSIELLQGFGYRSFSIFQNGDIQETANPIPQAGEGMFIFKK